MVIPNGEGVKKILVTGGAGFLGSHLCTSLIDDGHDVLCVDNLYSGDKRNILHLLDSPRFEFMRHDVCFPLYVEVDKIYNLACPASPVYYQRDPIQTTKVNVMGTINMLGLARRTGARILQASTSEVYGSPEVHPQPESYWGNVNPIGPRSCYDEGKRCAETLCYDYAMQRNTDVRVVRIFNTYGPNMRADDGRVVSNFIMQGLGSGGLSVYGDGSQTRSFCYVDDLIRGLRLAMETDDPRAGEGPINLGNPAEFTIKQLAHLVLDLCGKEWGVMTGVPLPQDDPPQRRPDISRAIDVLGWRPTVQLGTGLRLTIDWFRARYFGAKPQPIEVLHG